MIFKAPMRASGLSVFLRIPRHSEPVRTLAWKSRESWQKLTIMRPKVTGLPRRFAPRNDAFILCATESCIIVSGRNRVFVVS